jgi:hypothetical protein
MRTVLTSILTLVVVSLSAQLEAHLETFSALSEVEIDTVKVFDEWEMKTVYYPSGRKQDEVRIYVSSGCKTEGKCIIRYQHQVYFDQEEETFTLKEGKYLTIKNEKATYRHYGYWYNKHAKLYRNVKEKTVKNL